MTTRDGLLKAAKFIEESPAIRIADVRGYNTRVGLAAALRALAAKEPESGWIAFGGNSLNLPPERRYVLVITAEKLSEGLPVGVAVGYLKFAAGDKSCPYFVIPGIGGEITHYCDCLGDTFCTPVLVNHRGSRWQLTNGLWGEYPASSPPAEAARARSIRDEIDTVECNSVLKELRERSTKNPAPAVPPAQSTTHWLPIDPIVEAYLTKCDRVNPDGSTSEDIDRDLNEPITALRTHAEALRREVAELRRTDDVTMTGFATLESMFKGQVQRAQKAEAELAALRSVVDHLRWILPMAKGYAAEHNVGRNQEIVNGAESALADLDKREGKP